MNSNLLKYDPSRRDFLKTLGISALGVIFPWEFSQIRPNRDFLLGRIAINGVGLYDAPEFSAKKLKGLFRDEIYIITKVLRSPDKEARNRTWYHLDEAGYANSAYIQPVRYSIQRETGDIPEEGRVGEICVPFVDSYTKPGGGVKSYRLYYAAMFWVKSIEKDIKGKSWYKLLDDRYYTYFHIPAETMRIIPYSELNPISSMIDPKEKFIQVDLQHQVLRAYESEKLVFTSLISSGILNKEGGYSTPKGWYRTSRKRPCRHMAASSSDFGSGFDLPGVPWVSYFTGSGIAFHGTYWHNDYGTPHSHGCVNMTPKAARWIYLWTDPRVPFSKYYYEEDYGTQVQVI